MTDRLGRTSTLRRAVALWIAFAVLVALGVFTVLLPELRDDSDSDHGEEASAPADAPS